MRRGAAAVGLCLLLAACGGSRRPSSATPVTTPPAASIPAGTVLSVVSGEDGRAVGGATVVVSGQTAEGAFAQTLTTDASGRIVLDRPPLLSPIALVDIAAPAFVDRSTLLRSAEETQFSLWPRTSATGLDEDTSATLVYSRSTCPAQNTGTALLHRVGSGVQLVSVAFSPGVQDAGIETAHRSGIDLLNAAIGGAVAYTFTATGTGPGVPFLIHIDPADPTCTAGPEVTRAAAYLTLRGEEITGGRLVYCNLASGRDSRLVLHELGHTYGFYHSASTRDVMYCTVGRPSAFSPRETLVMALMRQRRSGNRWPDNDRQTVVPLGGRGTASFACGG